MTERHDVTIIGAGIAGLTVASELAAAGVDVVCFEARDRVGGRLLSVGLGADALDLGATWFWPGEHRVRRLCEVLGVDYFQSYSDGDALYEGASGTRRLSGNPISMPAYRFIGGAHGLTQALAQRLDPQTLKLNSPVILVDLSGEALVVTTKTASFRSKHLVLAVPPALAVSAMRFIPPFPVEVHRIAASTPVWMGGTAKIVVRYREPFWRRTGLSGAAVSAIGPLREVHDLCGPAGQPAALFGFTTGFEARSASTGSIEERVLTQLVRLFGPEAANPVAITPQDWSAEIYSSPPGVADNNNYALFGHPLYTDVSADRRLHWASTETSTASAGHIEGALAAAERTIRRVLTWP